MRGFEKGALQEVLRYSSTLSLVPNEYHYKYGGEVLGKCEYLPVDTRV